MQSVGKRLETVGAISLPRSRGKSTPNVVLIVMDTARASHLSCYGYHRQTTPNIDMIAERGVLYENAFAAASWTPPSHASIFTGKYPSNHKTIGRNVCLDKGNTTIAKVLAQNGYETLGLTTCQILGPGSGFEEGFKTYMELRESSFSNITRLKALGFKDTLRKMLYGPDKDTFLATEILKGFAHKMRSEKKPFFVFVNYFACHTPYDPPWPFKKRYCPNFNEPRFYMNEILLRRVNRNAENISDHDLDIQKLRWLADGGGGLSFAAKEVTVSDKEWDVVKSWYDGEIAYLDYQIGQLISELQELDLFNNTIFIVTADHGENFGDHGFAVHPLCLYDSLLKVPLIISWPDHVTHGMRISNVVSLIDIFPTVVDAANVADLSEGIDGRTLLPFERRDVHEFVCAEYGTLHSRGFGRLQAWNIRPRTREKLLQIDKGCKSIRSSTHKYILWSDKEELFDIRKDPFEEVDIVKDRPDVAKEMKAQLEKTINVSYYGPEDFPAQKEKQIVDRLRALGYV